MEQGAGNYTTGQQTDKTLSQGTDRQASQNATK